MSDVEWSFVEGAEDRAKAYWAGGLGDLPDVILDICRVLPLIAVLEGVTAAAALREACDDLDDYEQHAHGKNHRMTRFLRSLIGEEGDAG